ncbi:MAG TPA: MFS transporter [Acidimicrobiia bacterium]|nr:MFS transporter [Acidimicrobiia bacterium]
MDPRQRRSVVALLASVLCSSTAMGALTVVLGKQVFDLTGSELALGLLGLAEFLPSALLVFVTGTIADRFDRRRVACTAMTIEVGFVLGLAWYAGTDPTSSGPIFLLVIGYGSARAFAFPATRALPADSVPADRLPWLVARQSMSWQAASIVGPVLGGFLYVAGVSLPFLVAAGLLVVAAVTITFVQPMYHAESEPIAPDLAGVEMAERQALEPDSTEATVGTKIKPRAGMREALEGLRFVRSQPVLLGAISLDLVAVLFGGAVALLPAIAEDRLGVGAVGLGWLRAAVGIGAALVTLVLAVKPVTRRVGGTLLIAVAVFGVFTILLGVTTSFVIAFLALAVLSGADAVSVFIRGTLVPLVTPPDKRGRVLAVETVFIGASNELGAFESGVAGQLLGPAAAVVLGGAATLLVALSWGRLFPALRAVDRFPASVS